MCVAGVNDSKPRPVMVRLQTYSQRQEILRSTLKLKGSNIYFNEDVSKATSDIRKSKLQELKEKRSRGLIAYFSGNKIITKTRTGNETHTEQQTKRGPGRPPKTTKSQAK